MATRSSMLNPSRMIRRAQGRFPVAVRLVFDFAVNPDDRYVYLSTPHHEIIIACGGPPSSMGRLREAVR